MYGICYNITTYSYIDRDFLRQEYVNHFLVLLIRSKHDFCVKISHCQWPQDRVYEVQVCVGNSYAKCT